MKILVAIANHGFKNMAYLERLIDEYTSMSYEVDIGVVSNVPKDLGSDIEVAVGLPAKDPWSLPFAHKTIFAERANDYDLFIYSEDDTLVTQKNIEAFMRATEILPENEIAGFLRYEQGCDGRDYCSTIHACYHWAPDTVRNINGSVFAELTNAHSACYILTRKQLLKAIESGGYLVGPHQGPYDLLCTAATDPYTQCGFTKVVCISEIDDFLLHHLPNRYVGRMGIEISEMKAQIEAMLASESAGKDLSELLITVTSLREPGWDKTYYGQCRDDVLALVPEDSDRVLSVGCGWGVTESALVEKGVKVVGIPLDSVVAESAKRRGLHVLAPDLHGAAESLNGEKFDCIIFNDVLGRLQEPQKTLSMYDGLLGKNGCVIITARNFRHLKSLYRILAKGYVFRKFESTGIHFTNPKNVAAWIKQSGLSIVDLRYGRLSNRYAWISRTFHGLLDRFIASEFLFVARRDLSRP